MNTVNDENIKLAFQHQQELFFNPVSSSLSLSILNDKFNNERVNMSAEMIPYYFDTESSAQQWGASDAVRVANLRWLFEPREINMATWNMDATGFSQGYYRFINYGGFAIRDDLTIYFKELLKADPELQSLLAQYGLDAQVSMKEVFLQSVINLPKSGLCNQLKLKSFEAFK